ncbi:hypothetical protein R1flu_013355 [Riccia fluitans]|uniref:Uncharacterized protein n=1 Tax=Riccia fluitans TaxID=41844 RepID=A0ABD1YD02_9MARC
MERASCFLLVALVCAAFACCAATRNNVHSGARVHVDLAREVEVQSPVYLKIRIRLPIEDRDTCAVSCTAELEGMTIGDPLMLTEVPPYAIVLPTQLYGPTDLWYCDFEWVDHNLVIGKTAVWNGSQGNVTWKVDAVGLELLDDTNDSYNFVKAWKVKTSGIALFGK